MSTLSEPPISETLSRQRIAEAFAALSDPDPTCGRPTLTTAERRAIHGLCSESPHPLAGFAGALLDEWVDIATDDRVAGLLLFAEIANKTARYRDLGMDR